jgi:FlaA1/EpsC-like NDP-sugar epimerase
MKQLISRMTRSQKTAIVLSFDTLMCLSTFAISFSLRFGEVFPEHLLVASPGLKMSLVVCSQVSCFIVMGLYKGIWRFSSTHDLIRIIKGVSLAVPISFCTLFLFQELYNFPRSIFIIQWFLLLVVVGGSRFAYRMYRDHYVLSQKYPGTCSNTLILGAGYAGQQLLRDIKDDPANQINIIGFIDDDYEKRGKIIHGKKVLGNLLDIAQIAKDKSIKEVIIAIPSATKEDMSRMVSACNDTNIKVQAIPRLADIISGKLQITKFRKVTPSDLLGREQVSLNMQSMAHMICEKTVMVTGAGGSIGSELCIQIAKFKPSVLICFDISEFNLYELEFKLKQFNEFTQVKLVVGDVRDAEKSEHVFDSLRPSIVFHAAAYKHVPMMELNPFEAIKVNICGTQVIAGLADKYKLDKFVLVSTDKAVNPTNVMGTTKRVAEMVCQYIQKNSKTKFTVVRFGNVLGSSGSVIPRFQKQIELGGPVTVTHPDIVRYFMSIPEAAQLVIQAGALGSGGEILILDMGAPVKIVDLAKQMITLAGLKVDEDIKIEFTGLRPGEKLYEELLSDAEGTLPTDHERVRVSSVRPVDENLFESITSLFLDQDVSSIRLKLKQIVPEYEIPENVIGMNILNFNQSEKA